MAGLGGHRILDRTINAGKLGLPAMNEVLDQAAFIFPLELTDVTVVSGASSFIVTIPYGDSPGLNALGVVNSANTWEVFADYANVEIFTNTHDPIYDSLGNILWGRVISSSGSGGTWTFTINIYKDTDRFATTPTSGSLNTTLLQVVELPYRKPLAHTGQKDFKTDRILPPPVTGADFAALETRVDALEGLGTPVDQETPSGVVATGNYSFSFSHAPLPGTVELTAYGLSLIQGVHYNMSGSTLTYVAGFEPSSTENHRVSYRY